MSSQIEGTEVTVSDIVLHNFDNDPERSAADLRDIREAYNYIEAIRTGFDALDEGRQIDQELVCELHESLLVEVRSENKSPGHIRDDTPVMIGPDNHIENARFVPANPHSVVLLLKQLLSYIRSGSHPPLIDIAITHYQFETIHPFRDGNGRLGRLLIMLQLYQQIASPNRICTSRHTSTITGQNTSTAFSISASTVSGNHGLPSC